MSRRRAKGKGRSRRDPPDKPKRHAGPGQPTLYIPEYCEIVANFCAKGMTDFEVAQELRVHVCTLYRWKASHPEFCEALKVGKEAADDRVEASLFHRAVGYSHSAVKIFMPAGADAPVYAPYTEHAPPDTGAATLWLTNRRGKDWRSKQSLEHSGPNGGAIPIAQLQGDMTDDQAMEVYMRLIGDPTS